MNELPRNWFCACRTPEALELLKASPKAFALAYLIAFRCQWRAGFNRHDLAVGEALLGDYAEYGMSEREYRTAKLRLEKWHFATFKATNKGTVARLTDSRLFAILPSENDEQADRQATGSRQASDRQATTTNKETPINQDNYIGKTALPGTTENLPANDRRRPAEAGAASNQTDEVWLVDLKADPTYAGIDVNREHGKMVRWCTENRKQPTRRRFVNWLNRVDRTLTATATPATTTAPPVTGRVITP